MIALIPIKSLAQAKSRLQHRLGPEERAQLMHDTLRHTVRAVRQSGLLERVILVTRDPAVAAWADDWEIGHFAESAAASGLNGALAEARRALGQSTDALLILPGDVAWLEADDVRNMAALAMSEQDKAVVIAPDRHERGTNALLLRPPTVIDFHFGPDSAQQHAAQAKAAGITPVWYHSSSVSLDIDEPDDLRLYERAAFWLEME